MFYASYEDAKKLHAAAKANGWDEGDGAALDYAEATDTRVHTARKFADKDAAIAWLKSEINATRTVFGCGDIIEIEELDRSARCRYCTCGGKRAIHRSVVSDEGIDHEEAIDDCHNG